MTVFNIEIVSDTVCPWCYIGKRRLDQAISMYNTAHPETKDTFAIQWKPFYLDPNAPKKGMPKAGLYAARFGEARMREIFQRVNAVGDEVGIKFKHGGKTGDTRDSHRLIYLAGSNGGTEIQNRVVAHLLAAYHENEQDITSHAVLQKAGEEAGLDAAEVKSWLASDAGGAEVDREVKNAKEEKNIQGVPHFTFEGAVDISGGQEPAVFLRILERIKMMELQKLAGAAGGK